MKKRYVSILLAGLLAVSPVCQSAYGAQLGTEDSQVVTVEETEAAETEGSGDVATGETEEAESTEIRIEKSVAEEASVDEAQLGESEEAGIFETVVEQEEVSESEVESVEAEDTGNVFNEVETEVQIDEESSVEEDETEETSEITPDEMGVRKTARLAAAKSDSTAESPIESIEFREIKLIENVDGEIKTDYNDETSEESPEYFKYNYRPRFTVKMKDGTELESDSDGDIRYNDRWYSSEWTDDQSYENQWGIGQHTVHMNIMGFETTAVVEVIENPVESIEFEHDKLIENVDGKIKMDYNDETSERSAEYFKYNYNPQFTVKMKDGTQFVSDSDIPYNNRWYSSEWTDDQSYENQWGIGEHTVRVSIMGFETTVIVEVIENPIESIEFENLKLIENVDGYTDYDYNDEIPEESPEYFKYNYTPRFTVKMKDGTELESDSDGDVWYNNRMYYSQCSDEQSYENQWGVGTHTARMEIMGYEGTFTVEVMENPVESIKFENVKLIENVDGGIKTDYNYEISERSPEYFEYDYSPRFTVKMKDGTELESDSEGDIRYNNRWYSSEWTDDQSYENQWGIGEHVVHVNMMGFEDTFTVEVMENPVESIKFENVKLIENVDGGIKTDYNDETSEESPKYFKYDYRPEFTIKLKDGIEEYGYGTYGIYYNDRYYSSEWTDDQSYENQWGIGEHVVHMNIMGFETTAVVEVIENPVESIEFENVKLTENVDGYTDYDYNDETSEESPEYFKYDYRPEFTIKLKDGTEKYGRYSIYYNDQYYFSEWNDDQNYENPWGIGEHVVHVSMMGFEDTFTVEVMENPVESIKFENVKLIENADGGLKTDYNDETSEESPEYFKYNYRPQFTVKMKDGTELESDSFGDIYYNNRWYSSEWIDDQSYENQWGIGEHVVHVNMMGFEDTFTVEVMENPVASIEFEEIRLIKGYSGEWVDGYNEQTDDFDLHYYHYDIKPSCTIKLKNGKKINSSWWSRYIEYNGKEYWWNYSDPQSYTNQWDVGTYTIDAEVLGVKTSFTVEIVAIESVEVEDVTLIEHVDGSMRGEYNYETGEYENQYYHYSYSNEPLVTVKFSDGTISEGEGGCQFGKYTYSIDCEDDQSYTNQWGLGKHTATAEIFGVKCDFIVEVVKTPVVSAKMEASDCIENRDGYIAYTYTKEGAEQYFRYGTYPQKCTVTLKDGTVLEGAGGVEYNGKWYYASCTDDQSATNQWGLGKHTVNATIMGFDTSYVVEVVKTPVVNIEFEDIKLIENVDGYMNDIGYNPDTGEWNLKYWCYSYTPKYKVTLKDGTILESDYHMGSITYNDRWYRFEGEDDQSAITPWGVGKHTVTTNILGVDTSFVVEIIKKPEIKSVVFETVKIMEKTKGNWEEVYNPDTEEYDLKYYRYQYIPKYKVTLTDGTILESDSDGSIFYNKKYWPVYNDGQSYDNQWGVGKHTVSASILGEEKSFTVEIFKAGNTTLTGTITSYGTGTTPVTVTLLDGTIEIDKVTTTDGTYTFASVPSGTYTLQVSKENHVTRTYDITVSDEPVTQDVKICLIGDVTGDGKVNTRDLNRLYAHVNGTNPLTGYEFDCGDVTGDGKLNTRDLNRLYAHISETNLLW